MDIKPKILIICRDPGGAEALSPVIVRLIKEDKVEIVLIGYKFSEAIFTKKGISFKTLQDFDIKEVSPASMKRLLDLTSPNLIVLGTSQGRSIENDMVLAARERKIKTFSLLDYWNNYWQRFSCLETGERFLFLPDFIGIMDDFAKEEMIKEGFQPDRLLVTGQPYFDGLFEFEKDFDEDKRRKFKQKFVGSDSELLISFFSQGITMTRGKDENNPDYLGYTQVTILDSLVKSLDILQSGFKRPMTLFVKLHPKEPYEEVSRFVSRDRLKIIIAKDETNPRELMLASDLVTGMFTMVLVEAFLTKKRVLSIQIGLKKQDELVLSRLNLIQPIYKEEGLLPSLKENLFTRGHNKCASQFKIYPNSTKRVTQTVYNLLQ